MSEAECPICHHEHDEVCAVVVDKPAFRCGCGEIDHPAQKGVPCGCTLTKKDQEVWQRSTKPYEREMSPEAF
jgi:hypothetical protein